MFTSTLAASAAVLGLAAGYAIPSDNGFPDPDAQQLLKIETQAGGKLSNMPPPATLSAAGVANFQLIAFNENFEVAFFSSLIDNITHSVPGFDHGLSKWGKDDLLEIIKTVKAQEEIHAITAISTLEYFNVSLVPEPCTYKFPTASLEDAISLAETVTAVVLGTLQDAAQAFAKNGDDGPVRAISSVIGQEGEQTGFYRVFLNRKPSEKPFLTTSTASFAFSVLQQFIESCPFDINEIPIPIFPALSVLTTAEPKDMNLTFSADLSASGEYDSSCDLEGLFITYLVGLQLPISVPISDATWDGSVLTFNALFPYTENIMEGLSIAALTNSSGFASADDVPGSTLAAPGLIQVNELLSTPKELTPEEKAILEVEGYVKGKWAA